MAEPILTDEELAEIESRADRARKGPWLSFIEGRDHDSGSDFIQVGAGAARSDDIELLGATGTDQDFIAGARQDIPRLVAEVKRLRSLLADEAD